MSHIKKLVDQINKAKDTYNPKDFLLESMQMYLSACQQNAEKIDEYPDRESWVRAGSPTWGPDSEFAEWLMATKKFILNHRIPENKKKMNAGDEPSAFQKNLLNYADKLVLTDERELESFAKDRVFYEYFDWELHKAVEAIDGYIAGKPECQITDKDVVLDDLEVEIAKQYAKKFGFGGSSGLIKPVSDISNLGDLKNPTIDNLKTRLN